MFNVTYSKLLHVSINGFHFVSNRKPAAELAKVSALSSLQVLAGAKLKLDHPPELE